MKADYTTTLGGPRFQGTARAAFYLLTGGGRWLFAGDLRPARNIVASCVNDSPGAGAILSTLYAMLGFIPVAAVYSGRICRRWLDSLAGMGLAFVTTCRRRRRFILTR